MSVSEGFDLSAHDRRVDHIVRQGIPHCNRASGCCGKAYKIRVTIM